MITQGWPCWLSTILSFDLSLEAAYVALSFCPFFSPFVEDTCVIPWCDLADLRNLVHWPVAWDSSPVLVSGSQDFLILLMSKISGHVGPFIHALEIVFAGHRMHLTEGLYEKWGREFWSKQGLLLAVVVHAEFGGVTSARHLLLYRGVDAAVFQPGTSLQRKLSHIIQPAAPTVAQEIHAPEVVDNLFPPHP
jgi:hypothetical protein